MAADDPPELQTWAPDDATSEADLPKSGPRYLDAVEVGQGSMGRVMGVTDTHLGRRVAYKELRRKVESQTARARFLREARITARLQHPGIAPIYDVGTDDDGVPWYTMRFVEGQTLQDALDAAHTLEDRLALLPRFADACQAVAYAHARGVVHRDLKPENILVGEFGETLVVDWGLAKQAEDEELLDDGTSSTSSLDSSTSTGTRAGTVLGTPSWMSPEQARGEVGDLDARTDVWSLGVILYQVLAGERPFVGGSVDETLEKVRVGPIPTPTTSVPEAPGELAAIVERALRRNRDERYPTAAELAKDVEAHLSGGWVGAHRYTLTERAVRWLLRYRLLVGTAGVAAVALAAIGLISYDRVLDERDRAQQAEAVGRSHLAEAFAGKAVTALEAGDLLQAELFAAGALNLDERADARGVLARTRATWRPTRAFAVGPEDGCSHVDVWPDRSRMLCASSNGVSAWSLGEDSRELWRHTHPAMGASVSPDGTRVVAQTAERVSMIDVRTEQVLWTREAARRGTNPRPDWHASGRRLAFARGTALTVVEADGSEVDTWSLGSSVVRVRWFGDDLVVADLSGRITRFGGEPFGMQAHTERLVQNGLYALDANADRIAAGTGGDGVFVLDSHTLEVLSRVPGHDGPVISVSISPDGQWLASAGEDLTLRLVDITSGVQAFSLALPGGSDTTVDFYEPDKLLLASAGSPATLWTIPDERWPATLGSPESGFTSVAWHPDASHLATVSGTGEVTVWNRRAADPVRTRFHAGTKTLRDVVFGDASTVITTGMMGGVTAWDLDGNQLANLWQSPPVVLMLARDPLRGHLYGPDWEGRIHRWEAWGEPTETFTGDASGQPMWEASVSADGATLAYTDGEDELTVVTLPDRRLVYHLDMKRSPRAMALRPDGRQLAWNTSLDVVELHDLPGGERVAELTGPHAAIDDLEYSPDGSLLVASSWDQRAWVFDVRTGRLVAVLADHSHRVVDAEFSADGRWLATASWDHTARIWDLSALTADPEAILEELRTQQGVRIEGARMVVE